MEGSDGLRSWAGQPLPAFSRTSRSRARTGDVGRYSRTHADADRVQALREPLVPERRHGAQVKPRPRARRAVALPRALPRLRTPAGGRGVDVRLAHHATHAGGAAGHRRRVGGGAARRGGGDSQLGRRPHQGRGRGRKGAGQPQARHQGPLPSQALSAAQALRDLHYLGSRIAPDAGP